MKHLRIELKLTALVYAGEDVAGTEGPAPDRDPDAVVATVLTRIADLGAGAVARDAAGAHLANLMTNAAPILGERVRHELREKGL